MHPQPLDIENARRARARARREAAGGRDPGIGSSVRVSYPPIEQGWLGRPTFERDTLRAIPLFAGLDDRLSEQLLRGAYEHHAIAGEAIVEQWQVSRELYVVLDGAVEVTADGRVLTTCGPGEFFGELAALDWGAGFGRTRTATVTPREATRLLVLDWVLVHRLMQASAPFAEQLEDVSRAHLARY